MSVFVRAVRDAPGCSPKLVSSGADAQFPFPTEFSIHMLSSLSLGDPKPTVLYRRDVCESNVSLSVVNVSRATLWSIPGDHRVLYLVTTSCLGSGFVTFFRYSLVQLQRHSTRTGACGVAKNALEG